MHTFSNSLSIEELFDTINNYHIIIVNMMFEFHGYEDNSLKFCFAYSHYKYMHDDKKCTHA